MVINALPKFIVRWASGIASLPPDKRKEALDRVPLEYQTVIGRTAESIVRAVS